MKSVASLELMNHGECALIRVDPDTGVPVDEAGKWLTHEKVTYLIFETLKEAQGFAEDDAQRGARVEYSVLQKSGSVIWRMQANMTAKKNESTS